MRKILASFAILLFIWPLGAADYTKTQGTVLLAIQQIASNTVVKTSAQDVSSKMEATVFIFLGRDDTGGALTAGCVFRVQGSAKSSGDDTWVDLAAFTSQLTLPEAEAVSGTEAAGATLIEVASTTNLVVGDYVLLKNTTIGNSEFARIVAVVINTSVTLTDGITNAQTGSTIYDQAEQYAATISLASVGRIRLVADCSNTGKTVVVQAFMTTLDAIE